MNYADEILQRLNVGLLVVDKELKVVFSNRWFVERCTVSWDEIEQTTISHSFPAFERKRLETALRDAIEFGISSMLSHSLHDNIFPLVNKSGEAIDHAISIQAVQSGHGWHAMIQVTDVSSATRRERSLRKAYLDAEEAGRAKEEFLAAMSHELRTPLTTIIGNSEILLEQEHDAYYRQLLLAGVESAGRRQLALVNDILDMSKLESGKFSINEIPYDLMVLVTEVEHMLSAYAKDSGLDFVITQKSDEPYLLIGDGQRIGQILINLIGNAIKFTEKGKVKLTVWNNQNYLFFNVEDTGIGMAPDTIDKLFERFEQIDGAISRRFGGSGLGLFISENLANLMGGQIDVSSIEGKGSIFQLLLPYRRSSIPVKPVDERPTNSVLNEKLSGHVLIAEDTPELQLLERRILEGMGLTVSLAVDGGEVMEMVKQHSFDLILMDMQMPVLDGIEATKIIRDCGDQTTVIALTANVMQKHRDAFTAAGCDDFLSKPIDKQELRRILKFYLSKSHE